LARKLSRVRAARAEIESLLQDGALDPELAHQVTEQLRRKIRHLRGLPAVVKSKPPVEPVLLELADPETAAEPIKASAKPRAISERVPHSAKEAKELPAEPLPDAAALPVKPLSEPHLRGSVISAFMEERNILWGELVGGLLIVGCSIALVVTLWRSLESFPYFPFLLSATITLALYGAGQYTLHHWKLTSTSRGLLVIALLLAPLNLLLLSDAITRGEMAASLDVGVKLGAIALFAWVARGGGRDILTVRPGWRWLLAVAIVGPPAAELIPPSWFSHRQVDFSAWLGLACFAATLGLALRSSSDSRTNKADAATLDSAVAIALLSLLGLASFSLFVAWGLHVARSSEIAVRVAALAFPLALSGIPIIEAGLLVQRRTSTGGLRVTGTAIALAGFFVITMALMAAWPDPLQVLLVAAATALFLTRIAFRESLVWAQVGAIPSLALATVVAYHGLAGHWTQAGTIGLAALFYPIVTGVNHTLDPEAGVVLAILACLLAATAEILARRGPYRHAVSYALGGVATGLVGLFLVSVNGIEYPIRAAAVSEGFALALLVFNQRWQLRVWSYGTFWLLVVGSLWALHGSSPNAFDVWGTVLSLEALALAGLALGLSRFHAVVSTLLRGAARDTCLVALLLSGIFATLGSNNLRSLWPTGTLLAFTLTGLVLTRLMRSPLPTFFSSFTAAVACLQLFLLAISMRPVERGVQVALLTHGTFVIAAAYLFRHQKRLYARPFWRVSVLSNTIAAALLLTIPAAHALEWAGYAVWLGTLWLLSAISLRQLAAFTIFQMALSLAALFCGVAWIEGLPGQPTPPFRFVQPYAWQVYLSAIGLLSMLWLLLRRLSEHKPIIRELWLDRLWSTERVVLVGAIIVQLILAIGVILPAVDAEWQPQTIYGTASVTPESMRAFGSTAWVALGLLSLVVITSWRLIRFPATDISKDLSHNPTERLINSHLLGLVILFLTLPVIVAGTYAAQLASASALRWGLGVAFLVGSTLLVFRVSLQECCASLGFPVPPSRGPRTRVLLLLGISAAVVVFLTLRGTVVVWNGNQLSGPHLDSMFASMGPLISNLVPLALVVGGLAATALRERLPVYALLGGIVFTATLAGGYALGVVVGLGNIQDHQVRISLLIFDGAAIWSLAWLAARYRLPAEKLLAVQARLGLGGLSCLAALAVMALLSNPEQTPDPQWYEFGKYGWLALVLASGAALWHALRTDRPLKFHVVVLTAVIASTLAACGMQMWDTTGNWLSFHVLAAGGIAVGMGLVIATRHSSRATLWLEGVAIALTIFAIRGGWDDPFRPWLPTGLAVMASVLMGAAGIFGQSRAQQWFSVLLTTLAATLFWLPFPFETFASFLLVNAAGLAIASAAWTLLGFRDTAAKYHSQADLIRGVVLLFLGMGLLPTLSGERADRHWLTWGATGIAAVSMMTALWDAKALIARGGLFAVGVALVLLGVTEVTGEGVGAIWQTPLALSSYALVVGGLAVLRSRARPGMFQLPVRADSGGWLLLAEAIVGAFALALGIQTGLISLDSTIRMTSTETVLLLLASAGMLYRAIAPWSGTLQYAVVSLGVLVFASIAWAVPDPAGIAPWLERSAWLVVALAGAGMLAGELSARVLVAHWQRSSRSVGGISLALAILMLVINLLQQVPLFDSVTKRTPLGFAPVLALLLTIPALIVSSIRFALNQERDPLRLPELGRTSYVYLAEVLIVLFFIHIRFNVPELFLGTMVRYWTFTVMGLGFVGIGLAEFFDRRSIHVLAIPLRRTGVLLPLIPLVAFWLKPPVALSLFASEQAPGLSPFLSYLEKLPQHFDTYAWLWTLAGALYGFVALSRNSFGWALLGALATNAALWSMLTHSGVPFLLHPQAWVIPLALIVLISEHVNRHKLGEDLSNGLRYLAVTMIYTASAADLFIAGVGNSVWLPIILAIFCVAGVLLGIILRVGAFLFLGVGFLLLDVFAMIWHAAVDLEQTWVWYVSGIVLGVAILSLFAIFEKRKKKQAEG
jgi:hypothetical protein